MKSIICIIGTRPEVIKMAPVILTLQKECWARLKVVSTGQHRKLIEQSFDDFDIQPDECLEVMESDQVLSEITSKLLLNLGKLLQREQPCAVLILGDTTTVAASALACFYNKIPVAHIEAGLRTHDLQNPFPEEFNRVLVGKLATWHFAPTEKAYSNLKQEGVPEEKIYITGNTVIDALKITQKKMAAGKDPAILNVAKPRTILITVHRRESFGKPIENICRALAQLSQKNERVIFQYVTHPNPNAEKVVFGLLQGLPNVQLLPPMSHLDFLGAMKSSDLIVSDSCGVQEEAPALGKPVLIIRNETERPESVSSGCAKLIGTETDSIVAEVQAFLDDDEKLNRMAKICYPFGDGKSSERIVKVLRDHFSPGD